MSYERLIAVQDTIHRRQGDNLYYYLTFLLIDLKDRSRLDYFVKEAYHIRIRDLDWSWLSYYTDITITKKNSYINITLEVVIVVEVVEVVVVVVVVVEVVEVVVVEVVVVEVVVVVVVVIVVVEVVVVVVVVSSSSSSS